MNQISVDDISVSAHPHEIESAVKQLLEELDFDDREDKFLILANLIGQVGDYGVLKRLVALIRDADLLSKKHIGRLNIDQHSETDKCKILASIYSLQLAYVHFWMLNRIQNEKISDEYFEQFRLERALPKLIIHVEDGVILFNLSEVVKVLQKKITISDRLFAESLPPNERLKFLKKCISDLNNLWYITGIDFYKTQLEFFKTVSELGTTESVSKPAPEEKFEFMFANDGFLLFDHIMKRYVRIGRGRKEDIAHYYHLLYNDKSKFIHQRQEVFKEWFLEEYPGGDYLGKFRTLVNLKNVDRENNYKAAVEWLKSSQR